MSGLVVAVPVGPGHKRMSHRAELSIRYAKDYDMGPFEAVEACFVDDTKGLFGRAAARNHVLSLYPKADWYYFLDADDMMHRQALKVMDETLKEHPDVVGIWGRGLVWFRGAQQFATRDKWPMDWDDVIQRQNQGTFGIGNFVRGPEARELRFDESVPQCEGFEFCVSLIASYPWIKVEEPISLVDRDSPSVADHYTECPAPWTRAFWDHTLKWKYRGRQPLTKEELTRRHAVENERLNWCLSTPATLAM